MNMERDIFQLLDEMGILDWPTILVGWEQGWVQQSRLADYTTRLLESGTSEHDLRVRLLVDLSDNDLVGIHRDLLSLAGGESADRRLTVDKWRLARLTALSQTQVAWDEKVDRLEELRTEFGYPDDMRDCTRYRPSAFAVEHGSAPSEAKYIDPLDAMLAVISSLRHRLGVTQ